MQDQPTAGATGLYALLVRGMTKLIGIFSPKAARHYANEHKALRGYDAGKSGGTDRLWIPGSKTGDQEIRSDWRKVIDKARDLARNDAYLTDAMRKYVAYTVGTALWPQARIPKFDGPGLNRPLCNAIEDAHSEWAEHCCVDGKDWDDLKKLAARHFKIDGEIIAHKVSTKKDPFLIELLEPDQIDESIDGDLKNGNRAVRGIEFLPGGRPAAYHLLECHPGDSIFSTKSRRVPANQIIHIYDPDRVTESRGICKFVSSIIPAFGHHQHQRAIMDLLRIAAAFGIFVETEFPEDEMMNLQRETSADGQAEEQPYKYVNPAAFHYMRKGQKVNSFKPEQPTSQFKEVESSHLRECAMGFGMSYETFTGDLSNVNYSSLRGGQVNERVEFRMVSDMLIRKLCKPTYREWMDIWVAAGRIKLPDYWSRRSTYQRASWTLPGLPQTDPLKEENANAVALSNKTTNRRVICEAKGFDWEENLDELQEEMEELIRRGLHEPAAPETATPAIDEEEEKDARK